MTVDTTTRTPRWLRPAAWIAASCAVALGIVHCGQPDAADPALDAETMVAPEAETSDAGQERTGAETAREAGMTARVNAIRRDLRAGIAAGEITEEQARARLSRLRQRMAAAGGGDAPAAGERAARDRAAEDQAAEDQQDVTTHPRYVAARQDLDARVEAGEITEEQARERLAGLRRILEGRGRDGGS